MPAKKGAAAMSDLPHLAAPARRALTGAGIASLANLSRKTEADVTAPHGMGSNAMASLGNAMKANGLAFAKR